MMTSSSRGGCGSTAPATATPASSCILAIKKKREQKAQVLLLHRRGVTAATPAAAHATLWEQRRSAFLEGLCYRWYAGTAAGAAA